MKACRKCNVRKSLTEYYAHKQMRDGHLNICIDCTRKRVRDYSRSERGREYDRKRNKTDKRKGWLIKYQRLKRQKDPVANLARNKLNRAVRLGRIQRDICRVCGDKTVQGHHEDYSKPLEVIWLCGYHHRGLHSQYRRKF